jgi:DNA-binding transcriptional LysR family regulator
MRSTVLTWRSDGDRPARSEDSEFPKAWGRFVMVMELRQLRAFDAVIAHGTVTDAAVALGRAPSSVSEQIRTLEASLGVALFERTRSGLRPTAAGDRLTAWARRLLAEADQARREVTGTTAPLRLGALETIAATHVPHALARLAQRRPDLGVEIRADADRTVLLSEVAAGALDAALLLDTGALVGGLGFGVPQGPRLDFADLENVPLVLVAAPSHPLAGAAAVSRDDLRGARLLVANSAACSFTLAGEWLIGPVTERVRAGGVAVVRACAQQGLGVALLPEFAVAAELAAGTLVRLAFPAPDLSLRLVWREDRESAPGVKDMLYALSDPS